jgi:hypothetical protein
MGKPNLTALYRRRKILRQQLNNLGHILRGSVVQLNRVCGKPNCHCQRGEKHPGNFFSMSFKGKTKMFYLSPPLVKKVRSWTMNYKRACQIIEELSSLNIQIFRQKRD